MHHTVDITRTAPPTAAVTRFHVAYADLAVIGERMGRAFGAVAAALGQAAIRSDGPALAYYEPTPDGFDVSAGFRVPDDVAAPAGLERLELGAVEVAHATHIGSYRELTTAYADIQTEVEHSGHSLSHSGPMWEEYWSAPETPEDQTRTEIYWPLSDGAAGD